MNVSSCLHVCVCGWVGGKGQMRLKITFPPSLNLTLPLALTVRAPTLHQRLREKARETSMLVVMSVLQYN